MFISYALFKHKIYVPSFGRQKIPCPDITLIFCLCYVYSLFAAHGVGK